MGLCSALKELGYRLSADGLWEPPDGGWPKNIPNPEEDARCLIALLRSELAGDRETFERVFGRRIVNLLEGGEK